VTPWRTNSGGRIDRTRPIGLTFDGRSYPAFAGDTLASALLANGVHLVGRSFKYHRPRGILAAGAEEPNALVAVIRDAARRTPNLRATQVEVYEGLVPESQNRWPTLGFAVGALTDLQAPGLAAGFYYKTFMWPRSAWHAFYEPRIRAAAGLGVAADRADPDRYGQRHAHCEVLVVGAGPAGLAAALSAAASGARVILCDEQAELGGSLLAEGAATIDDEPAPRWLATTLATLAREPNVTLLPRTTAFGYFAHNLLGLNERLTDHLAAPDRELPRERLWQVRAREVVLATGAIERPLLFPGNDRPGIMLASAARSYLNRYGVRVGSRAVVLAGSDAAYQAALELHGAGVEIAIIADVRTGPHGAPDHDVADGPAAAAARRAGLPIELRSTVLSTAGRLRVTSVTLGKVAGDGSITRGATIACDVALMSGGFTPSIHLFSQSRGKLAWNERLWNFVPGEPAERERSAGACRGIDGLGAVLEDGAEAGAAAAAATGHHAGAVRRLSARFVGSAMAVNPAACRSPATCRRRKHSSISRTT
jgi:sarcosine oxidase subunit alpha